MLRYKTLTQKQILQLLESKALLLIVVPLDQKPEGTGMISISDFLSLFGGDRNFTAWTEDPASFKVVANLLDILKANGVQVDDSGNVDITTIPQLITFNFEV